MGLLDGLLEKALVEALKHFDYGEGQLRDWLGYLRRENPEFFGTESSSGFGIHVPEDEFLEFARAAMKAAVETILHGSPPGGD